MCPACYQPGFYLEDNDQMQLQRTERLAKDNHPTALHTLGTLYVLGHGGVTRDTAKGERYLHEAFNAGSEAAGQFIAFKHAGQVHSEDEVDNIQAKTWYEKLPRSAPAQHGLAELYLGEIRGIQGYQGISMDRNKAMELLRKSSEQLYPPALKRYSCMLFEDHCFEEALKWSLKGASDERSPFNTSYVACQGLTAVLYNQEYSNFRLARFWAQRALDNGDAIGVPCNQQIALREVLESIDQSIWKMCGCCKKESPQVRCGSCLAAAYCDQACQRKDWKQHKKVCKDVPKILTKEDAGLID
jgi:TPR repeat protein